jgi:two-component system response regulator
MNRRRTILLVEDTQDDVDLTLRAFERSKVSHEIAIARDGEEAIDYLLAQGRYAERKDEPLPQVVLLDIKLPKLSGLEVLERLRKNPATRRLPVVMLTSSNEDRDRLASYDLGANSYVRKPVDFSEFIDAARQLGVYWLQLNEPAPSIAGMR